MPVSEEKTTAYQATESERAIIGAILRGDILPRNIELTLEDFTDLICHEVFAVMQKLDAQNKTCDLVTVSDAMPNFDSTLLVDLLQSGMPSLVLCDQYVANVKAASMRRALCKIAQQTVELSRNELTDPVKAAEEIRGQIDELAKNGPTQEIVSIPQMILNMHDYLFAEQKTDDSMHTGIGRLDGVLGGGIRGGKLCIIGARPSVGKSALGLFIATNAARSGKHVLYVSLEMDEAELYDRIIARFSGVPVDAIEARNFSDEQIQSVVAAYAEIGQIQLSISTQAQTPLQIRSLALRQRQETGIDMVVVDYLQLLRSGRKTNNRAEEVGEISRALKRLAMELKIPVIAMTQMNRQSEMGTGEGGRMPKMSESRESGTIEQDANQFLILHAPDIRTVPEPWQQMAESCQMNGWTFMLINVAKNRNGRKGILPIAFDAPHMNFFAFERDTQGG